MANELDEVTGPINSKGNGQELSKLDPKKYKQATGVFFGRSKRTFNQGTQDHITPKLDRNK